MARALELARLADFGTSPNPMVGAVVTVAGREVGAGHHARAGLPHAEVVALEQAGSRARGADLWVTLEPCCTIGRTGPCTDRVVGAGVARVHVATVDPNPAVAGRGIAALEAAGIEVVLGERGDDARRLIEFYSCWVRTGRPFVTLKVAMSLDGKVTTSGGESQWITGPEARADGHRLRHVHDAILVGSGTVLADDPSLTARFGYEGSRQPLRVVADRRLRTPLSARLLRQAGGQVVIATGPDADRERRRRLTAAGAEVIEVAISDTGIDLPALLGRLAQRGIVSVLVEGGPTLMGSLLMAGIGNRVVAFLAPLLLGGSKAPGPVGGSGFARLAGGRRLHWTEWEAVGQDLRLTAEV